MSAPNLVLPDQDAHFRLETDASRYVTGAILSQLHDDEKWHPVGFTSKSLNPAERNYAIYDKELLSVICGLEEWRHILEGTKHTIEILNDHRNLTYFRTAQTLNCRQARWSLYLSHFDYSLAHRAGRHSSKPDALSRCVDHQVEGDDNEGQVVLPAEQFEIEPLDMLTEHLATEETDTEPSHVHIETEGSDIMDQVRTDRDKSVVRTLKELGLGANLRGDEWEERNGLVLFRGKVYVPLDAQL